MRGASIFLVSSSILVVLLVQSVPPAHAAWPHDPYVNLPLCTATSEQKPPVIASDAAGRATVVWLDFRVGEGEIYAQRVDASGAVHWAADGVGLCAAAGGQSYPAIALDGEGGALVAWMDERINLGNADIYAQRVDASGTVRWAADGVPICTAAHTQWTPIVVPDGSGGAIVAWPDGRVGDGSYDLYAQRVDASGAVLWTSNGVALCTAANNQEVPVIASDGAGGAIVVWQDSRGGSADIYAQRIDAAGTVRWAANGVALSAATNAQTYPAVVADGAGGAIIAWQDYRGGSAYDIYAQRVNAAGITQWTANGLALCTAASSQLSPTLVADGVGGATVAWSDSRGGAGSDVYAQRVRATGVVAWTANGVAVCTAAGNQDYPKIVTDDATPEGTASGVIVAWTDARNGNDDLYAQRVNGDGFVQWSANGIALSVAAGLQSDPAIAPDGAGGAIVTWNDQRGGHGDIYAQRIEHFGYLGSPEPVIATVADVPNDQGGLVNVSWYASWLDPAFDANLAAYDVLRAVPLGYANAAVMRGARRFSLGERVVSPSAGDILAQPLGAQTYFWEYLGSVSPLHYVAGYGYVAPTTGDSLASSNPLTAFMVVGRNSAGTMYWASAPASGYSTDDLAPAMPEAFTGEYAAGTAVLHWQANGEADLAGYRLYRVPTPDFEPGPEYLVAEQTATDYVDAAGTRYYYKLCAVDVHGNQSGYAILLPAGTVGVDAPAPATLSLALGSANPGRGGAVLRWALPTEGAVRLVVHDVAGRAVRELAVGRQAAGEYRTQWDGRDAAGVPVAAGLYLARLEAAGRRLSVRIVLTR